MWKLLERLRAEPPESRRWVAFIVALCLTGVIGIAWFMSLSVGSSSVQTYDKDAAAAAPPWQAVVKAVTDTASSIQEFIGSLQQETLTFIASSTATSTIIDVGVVASSTNATSTATTTP